MAIEQGPTTSFLLELLQGIHDLDGDTLKIALYSSSASLDASTTAYSSTNEVSASGYTAGGASLTATLANGTLTGYVDFSDVSWSASLTARGALIYNSSKANRSIFVLDFGSDKVSSGTFTITFPAPPNAVMVLAMQGSYTPEGTP